jgi:hypothetical protein
MTLGKLFNFSKPISSPVSRDIDCTQDEGLSEKILAWYIAGSQFMVPLFLLIWFLVVESAKAPILLSAETLQL